MRSDSEGRADPDPGGGHVQSPALTDRFWYPLYEKMVELDVPAMIHVSGSCNPWLHATGLRFIIPHGGGAVPYHWGRYRGLADMLERPDIETSLMNNVFFDTCVYHHPGIDLLADVIANKNILFGSEMIGAVRGVDPKTGDFFDDARRYIDALQITQEERRGHAGDVSLSVGEETGTGVGTQRPAVRIAPSSGRH